MFFFPEYFGDLTSERQQVWAPQWVLPLPPGVQSEPESKLSCSYGPRLISLPKMPQLNASASWNPRTPASRAFRGLVQLRAICHYSKMSKTNQRKGRDRNGWEGGGGEEANKYSSVHYHMNSQAVGGEASSRERTWFIRRLLQLWKDKHQLTCFTHILHQSILAGFLKASCSRSF